MTLRVSHTLDLQTELAARAFIRRLDSRYAVHAALLFGSRARGTHTADSDADIAVILKGDRGDRGAAVIDMASFAVEIFEETGILVQALPLWEGEFRNPATFSNPVLIENIRREGLPL